MLLKLFFVSLYADYFSGTYQDIVSSSLVSSFTGDGCWIHSCFFSSLSNRAISLSQEGSKICIEKSVFEACSSNGIGGAIYVSGTTSQVVMVSCCGVLCSSMSSSHFAYLAGSIIRVNHTSFYKCAQNSQIFHSFKLYKGQQLSFYDNSTKNDSNAYSGMIFHEPVSNNFGFSTLISNHAYQLIIISFVTGPSFSTHVNFVNNSQALDTWGLICNDYSGSTTLEYWVVANNISPYMFAINGGSFKVYHSSCQANTYWAYSGGPVVFSNCTIQYPSHQIKHFSTAFCNNGEALHTLSPSRQLLK